MHVRLTILLMAGVPLAIVSPSSAGASTPSDPGGDTHPVEHAMGTTDVPNDPLRIVVLDSSFLDATVALGVTPIGATEGSEGFGVPDYLADRVPDVELVGLTNEPNLEAVAALDPDLILGARVRHETLYEDLAAIAPTVFTESSGTNWKDGLAVTADALNRVDDAAALLEAYEARADEVGEAVGADEMTASIVRFLLPDEIRLYGPETFSGTVLTDIGFTLGEHAWNEYSMFLVSSEQLALADADVVFSTAYGGTDSDEFADAFGTVDAVWQSVPAVADRRQHWVEDHTWMTGIGLIGAGLILDDIESLLAA